jgi:hypothetical protein
MPRANKKNQLSSALTQHRVVDMKPRLIWRTAVIFLGLLCSIPYVRANDEGGLVGDVVKLKEQVAQLQARLERSEKWSGVVPVATNTLAVIQIGRLAPTLGQGSLMTPGTQVPEGKSTLTVIAVDENLHEIANQQVEFRWSRFATPPAPLTAPFLVTLETSPELQPFDVSKVKAIALKVKRPHDENPGNCGFVIFDQILGGRSTFAARLSKKFPPFGMDTQSALETVAQIPVNSRIPNGQPPSGFFYGSIPILLKFEGKN